MTGRAVVGLILIALVAAGCALLGGPVVRIDEGISPRMTPDQVSTVVIDHIHEMEQTAGSVAKPARVVSMSATTATGVALLEPDSGQGQQPQPGIQWLVRAEGTFTNNRAPTDAARMISTTGYFVISDADGSTIGFGFP
jgi:hypothetical protein